MKVGVNSVEIAYNDSLQYPLTDRGNEENPASPPAPPGVDNSSRTALNTSTRLATGTPVLFLHAFPLNKSMWTGQVDALLGDQGDGDRRTADPELWRKVHRSDGSKPYAPQSASRYRLVALDWRGFGESSAAGELSTMELFADDVAGLMDTLGIQQAVLCGLSMGGYVAFAFLRKYPQRVQGLILADTRPGGDSDEIKASRESTALLALSQGPGAVADLLIPRLLSDYTRQHNPVVEQSVRQMISAATPQGIAAASRGMALRSDASDLLSSISCPTLVVSGEQDVLTPPAVVREYAARIPGSQCATIPDAGHLSNLEQPEAFLAIVRNFLLFQS
jgi:pimeloyl-ACP methyl ester carboxylesterase